MGESRLMELRRKERMSLRQVARNLTISNSYLSQLETGAASNPRVSFAVELARFYRVDVAELAEAMGWLDQSLR